MANKKRPRRKSAVGDDQVMIAASTGCSSAGPLRWSDDALLAQAAQLVAEEVTQRAEALA